jgi:hypothetical protein
MSDLDNLGARVEGIVRNPMIQLDGYKMWVEVKINSLTS